MANFVLMGICLFAGIAMRQVQILPEQTPRALNGYVLYLAFPALVLLRLPDIVRSSAFGGALALAILGPWLIFAMAAGLISFLGSRWNWSARQVGGLVLVAGLGNTSFVGFPLLEAFYGRGALPFALVIDQGGTFLTLSVAGIVWASLMSGVRISARALVKRVLTFPPFAAILLSLFLEIIHFDLPQAISGAFEILAQTLIPIALVSVGFQLRIRRQISIQERSALSTGLLYKLFLAPVLMVAMIRGAEYFAHVAFSPMESRVLILEAAMAPMITGAVVATEFGLAPELVNLMVGIGIPLSFLTVTLWKVVLS